MNPLLKSILSTSFLFSIIRVATPIIFPAIGVAITSLSGSINIALEGIMLVAAFVGVVISAFTSSLILALSFGVLAGVGIAALLGYFHLKLKADIVLAAIALNLFASGITVFLLYIFAHDKGVSSSLKSLVFPNVQIPVLRDIPILKSILNGQNVLVYVSFLAVIVYYIIIFHTPLGLRIRAVGQNPDAADSVGINVARVKMYALLLSGLFGAFGGLYLSMGYVSWFGRDMTAGRGFIAIAASSIGGNLPLGTFLGSLLFGVVYALANFLATINIPSEIIQVIPYIITVVVLTLYSAQTSKKKEVGEE
jgi:simple sugar transport system permease protein